MFESERSDDYRKKFFESNKGILSSGIYHCSYCGKILTKKNVSVDHLIPVHRVKRFSLARLIMLYNGINDVNDIRNLVPSCKRCNSKKGSKMGLWLYRGNIGKHFIFWGIIWTVVLSLFIVGIIHSHEIYDFIRTMITDLTKDIKSMSEDLKEMGQLLK